ncbi:MAG: hypothetical protein AMXMBFR48_03790 [Ignavibacteriales bacterium]
MKREIHRWWSPALHKDMEIAVYGHYGFGVLMFPTAGADYLEYERFNLIDRISDLVDSGKCKLFSINSINNESWLNRHMNPRHKSIRHQQYNHYIAEEVVPFIFNHCQGRVPLITAGASLGAFHAANSLFRRPDLFSGTLAMSGSYDLKDYTDGYYDDDVYFNSPVDYLYHIGDEGVLSKLRNGKKIIIATGQGSYENPGASRKLSGILTTKGIPHELEVWGHDMPHDWPTWYKMFPYFMRERM